MNIFVGGNLARPSHESESQMSQLSDVGFGIIACLGGSNYLSRWKFYFWLARKLVNIDLRWIDEKLMWRQSSYYSNFANKPNAPTTPLENIFFFLSDLFIARILYAVLPENFSCTIVLVGGRARRFKNIIFRREKRRVEKGREDGLENNLVKSFPLVLTVSKISYLCSAEPI